MSHRMHKIHALSQPRRTTSHMEQQSVGTRLVFVLSLGLATISAWQEEITTPTSHRLNRWHPPS
jgi:hypothetical protein